MFRLLSSLPLFAVLAVPTFAGAPPRPSPPDPYEIGRMGIQFGIDGELLINSIDPTLPIARSGLKVGDVIVKVGSVTARQTSDVQRFVFGLRPGTKVKVVIRRDGAEQTYTVMLGEANDEIRASARRLANPNAEDDVP